ncbi:HpcH/HpaI aldolase family protein [Gimesia maris]|uniref:5-keto-4-deoxy-D-glucarate aldolase n=1 Tax=Gimesia maris TaxID=122 RepID=A0ABX5YW13_9PLAN|nr:aldolase/citrate lyase family protein [Gimesia maris]EDL61012.1 hypothetical protein PM8797T_09839 [Gimesia maris DSM 8797]QEG20059.1 5-keto-4-deoxy-D-glucarate aldolase [Gimesia maris]QGQ32462.1 hypothetical protein F1729_29560 [Gimesia maris]
MLVKKLKDKLIKGETVYGSLFQYAVVPAMVESIPENSLDFVIVTPEHTTLDLAEFLPLRYALNSKGIACLARTHSRDAADVARVCDTFDGVVVPYVEEYEQAQQLAAAAVYRPLKGIVLDEVLKTGKFVNQKTADYIEKRNENTLFIPMIESVPGIQNLEKICSIPGVHAVFVGPGDLTANMGIPGEYDNPDLIAAIQKVIDIANQQHVAAGCWFGTTKQAVRTIRQGARLVVYANDGLMLKHAMQSAYSELRKG